jgi:hypothetical protein
MQLGSGLLTTERISASASGLYSEAEDGDELYYIQNAGVVGNCARWWRPRASGYTCNLDAAGKYTHAEAEKFIRNRPGEDFMWSVAFIDEISERHVDCQKLGIS